MTVTAVVSYVDSRGLLFFEQCNIFDQNYPEITRNYPEMPRSGR